MKKFILFFLLSIPYFLFSQVTTNPTIPIITSDITVIFDATGTPLENYSGTIYTHTGATVNGTQWQNVIGTWGDNVAQPALTNTSGNIYEFTITPDIYTFYGINGGDTITELSFVFRSADGGTQSEDIFIDVFEAGLNVAVTNPLDGDVFSLNDVITLSAESSINADLELFVNNVSQQTSSNTTAISSSYTFTTTGLHTIKATATQDSTEEDEISVYVASATQNEALPTGVTNGFNDNGDGTVTFVLEAPNKTHVFLIGGFNNWLLDEAYQMKKDGDNFWLTVSGLDSDTEYAYQYYIDFSIKVADPYAHKVLDPDNDQYIQTSTYPNLMAYPSGETTGIVSTFKINEENYTWQNTSFTKPDKENLVIYEMLVRDFTESSTYQEALIHLDYLQELGVNAIELMPINEFEGNISWGYNPSFYMALDKAYGTANDLKEFVDECHQRGIAVITDVVFNHSYSQSPLLQMYWDSANNRPAEDSPYYNENHNLVDNTSAHWGYDFNHESNYTVNFFNDVLSFWMNEYQIDGFRFDFTKGFSNTIYTGSDNWASAYDADRIENLKAYADHVWGNDPGNEAYVIFEHLSDNSEETELANYGIMLWGNLNHSFNQNTMGYSEGADVSWLSYQNRGWNNPHVVGYMESHDEERLMVKNIAYGNSNGDYDIKDLSTALDRQEAASVIFYSVPGPKMLWQFGELGYDKSINCEDDINDGSCRLDEKPVAWTLGYDNDSDRLDLYNLTAKMIMLKTTYPSTFNTTDFSFSLDGLVKRINLNDISGDFDVTVIANFDVTTQSINPIFSVTGTWYDILNNNTPFDVSSSSSTISLEPGEYRVYGTQPVIDPNDLDSDGVPNSDDLCPATPIGAIVDVTGCPVFTLPSDNFLLQISSETCRSSNNGSIAITAQESLNYTITITGNGVNVSDTFTDSYTMDNLEAADYEVCITVDGQSDYEICFNATIDEPEDLSVLSRVSNSEGRVSLDLSGSETYTITFNDQVIETTNSSLTLDLKVGNNSLKVEGKKPCQGIFEKTIYFGSNMTVFPNPVTSNKLSIYLGNTDLKRAHVLLYTILGEAIYNNTLESKDNIIRLDFSPFAKGIYILNVITDVESVSFKVIK